MKKSTIRVAELATIFYALMVFMSLLVDTAYYAPFHIRIVSYMSTAEILLSFLEQPLYYIYPLCYLLIVGIMGYYFVKPSISRSPSIHNKYSIAVHYLRFLWVVPLIVYACWALTIRWTNLLEGNSMWILVTYIMTPSSLIWFIYYTFNSHHAIPYPDWSSHPQLLRKYKKDSIRCRVAQHTFSVAEKQYYTRLYDLRIPLLVLTVLISITCAQSLAFYSKALHVKSAGNGVCVVLKGDGIDIDTRDGQQSYIGESAGYIFLYDRATKGTMLYNRQDIRSYTLITDYVARAQYNYSQQHGEVNHNGHLLRSDIYGLDLAQAHQATSIYTFTLPEGFVSTYQNGNHRIWIDSVTHTSLEQLDISREDMKTMPTDTTLFALEIYASDDNLKQKNMGCCETRQRSYTGNRGERIITMVGDGPCYSAWLFYDPSGQNTAQGKAIMKSIRLSGSIWEQCVNVFMTNKIQWSIILVIATLIILLVLLLAGKMMDIPCKEGEVLPTFGKVVVKSFFYALLLVGVISVWLGVSFLPFTQNRLPLIGTALGILFLACFLASLLSYYGTACTKHAKA